jgi:hypothetical protein
MAAKMTRGLLFRSAESIGGFWWEPGQAPCAAAAVFHCSEHSISMLRKTVQVEHPQQALAADFAPRLGDMDCPELFDWRILSAMKLNSPGYLC